MVPQPAFRVPAVPPWSATSAGRLDLVSEPPPWNATREAWLAAFTERFAELRPQEDDEVVQALAADLWPDVGGHDPVLAAEMEHEATFGD